MNTNIFPRDFAQALDAFDATLDRLARAHNCQPSYETETITLDYPCNHTKKGTGTLVTDPLELDILKDIKQVIFNDPATIVTFADGSKVCVKACANDKFSKELGLIYAIVKRLYANDVDDNGYLKSSGFGEKITKIINGAIDQKKLKADKDTKKKAEKTNTTVETTAKKPTKAKETKTPVKKKSSK